jgi:acyl-CoA thioester hydrolase
LRVKMPDAEALSRLPSLGRVRVLPEWEDINGHVNVQHYLTMYDRTNDAMLELLGISADWVARQRVGLVDLEHHIWFNRELHVGDVVEMYLRITGLSERYAQGIVFLQDAQVGHVACAIEFLSTSVDLDARRVTPLPPEVRARLAALYAAHDALDWPAPRSGSISV